VVKFAELADLAARRQIRSRRSTRVGTDNELKAKNVPRKHLLHVGPSAPAR
jgi:hypothetical protein